MIDLKIVQRDEHSNYLVEHQRLHDDGSPYYAPEKDRRALLYILYEVAALASAAGDSKKSMTYALERIASLVAVKYLSEVK